MRQVLGPRVADATALLFVFFPLSGILSFAYTEGLFLTAAAGCLYALGRRLWITAALLACLAGLTRNTGIVVVLCVLVVALPAAWRDAPGCGRWRPPPWPRSAWRRSWPTAGPWSAPRWPS